MQVEEWCGSLQLEYNWNGVLSIDDESPFVCLELEDYVIVDMTLYKNVNDDYNSIFLYIRI